MSAPQPLRFDRQWGVAHLDGSPSPLVFPCVAQWTARGTCLIVDRCLPDNRLLEVSAGGEVLWSFEAAPRMNFAHLLADGTVLFVQGSSLFALEPGRAPELVTKVPSPHSFNCGSVCGDLIALGGDDGVHLVSTGGRHLRRMAPDEASFIEPADVHLLPSGAMVIVDGWMGCAVEIDAAGRRTGVFGRWRAPGLAPGRLSGPYSACRLRDGRTTVADWRAHRLVVYEAGGREVGTLPDPGRARLFAPSYVRETPDGDLVVAETGSRRVVLRDLAGAVKWEFGAGALPEASLSFPRMAEPIDGSDEILVCDSHADRIVIAGGDGAPRWALGRGGSVGEGLGLHVPRTAAAGRDGAVTIADGLNGRVLVVDRSGCVRREVHKVWMDGRHVALRDPHHALTTPQGELLVVDSDLALVMLVDEDDRVTAAWGAPDGETLADPHQAQLLPGGRVLIADSGHERVVELDRGGRVLWTLTHTQEDAAPPVPLSYPRCVELLADGSVLVVDTGAARVVRTDRGGRVVSSVGPVIDVSREPAAAPELRVPRWATVDERGRILVTDSYNSRVVAFAPASGTGAGVAATSG